MDESIRAGQSSDVARQAKASHGRDFMSDLTELSMDSPKKASGGLRSPWVDFRDTVSLGFWPIVSLLVMVGCLYAPVLKYEFLNLDDPAYIVENDLIKSWHPRSLWRVMTEPVARNYAPLTIGTFLVEHTLWGLNSSGYHATNVLLHAINAVLVFVLIRQLTRHTWTAWMVAALFAVHPMQVETVVWVASRKTLLSSTFMLLSGLCYLRPGRTGKNEVWGALWLVLGLLSKASTVSIPPIVVAYDIFIRRKSFADAVVRQILPGVLCVMLINYTMSAQVSQIGGTRDHLVMNKFQIAGVDATLLFRYLSMLAVPRQLCVYYAPPWKGIWPQIAVSVVIWSAVTVFLWRKQRQYPRRAFAWAAGLWLLFPVMNFFPITTLMNDRYMYLPCLAVMWMAVEGLRQVGARLAGSSTDREGDVGLGVWLTRAVCVVAIGAYACATQHYLPVWRNPMTLWAYARQQTPSLIIVHRQWADALHASGDIPAAIAELQDILDHMHPDEGEANLAKELQAKWAANASQ